MTELMVSYTEELTLIAEGPDAEAQLIQLIQLMIKYAHIHDVLHMIPLMQSDSQPVQKVKENFAKDHLVIINYIIAIVEFGKKESVIRGKSTTNISVLVI